MTQRRTIFATATTLLVLAMVLLSTTSANAVGPWIPAPKSVNTCAPNCLMLAQSMLGVMDNGDGVSDRCSNWRFQVLAKNPRIALVTLRDPGACMDARSFGWLFHNDKVRPGPGQLWEPVALTSYSEFDGGRYCQFGLDRAQYLPGDPGYERVISQIKRTGICG